jgi:hypothetical protein
VDVIAFIFKERKYNEFFFTATKNTHLLHSTWSGTEGVRGSAAHFLTCFTTIFQSVTLQFPIPVPVAIVDFLVQQPLATFQDVGPV